MLPTGRSPTAAAGVHRRFTRYVGQSGGSPQKAWEHEDDAAEQDSQRDEEGALPHRFPRCHLRIGRTRGWMSLNRGDTWTVSAGATVPSTEPGDDTVRDGLDGRDRVGVTRRRCQSGGQPDCTRHETPVGGCSSGRTQIAQRGVHRYANTFCRRRDWNTDESVPIPIPARNGRADGSTGRLCW